MNRNSKNILLHKATEDVRLKSILIPIVEGYFEYQFTAPSLEAYHLVFEDEEQKGMWRPVLFFSESGEISFTLHPLEEFDKNQIQGGNLNRILLNYGLAYDKEFKSQISSLRDSINAQHSKGESENKRAEALEKELKAIDKKALKWREKYIENNPSLVS